MRDDFLTVELSAWGSWLVWLNLDGGSYMVSPTWGFRTEQEAEQHRDAILRALPVGHA